VQHELLPMLQERYNLSQVGIGLSHGRGWGLVANCWCYKILERCRGHCLTPVSCKNHHMQPHHEKLARGILAVQWASLHAAIASTPMRLAVAHDMAHPEATS
jgi:hypothetical protein